MIYLHSYLRWLILIGVLYLIILTSFYLIIKKNMDLENLKKILIKNFLFFLILVDFQFLIGIYLFISNLIEINLSNFFTIMKIKESRFLFIEHPVMMLIFIFWNHFMSRKIKKMGNIKQIKIILAYLIINFLILLFGIPWFRPLFRF